MSPPTLHPLQLHPEGNELLHPNSAFENMKPSLTRVHLPGNWQAFSDSTSVEYCNLSQDPNGMHQITCSIVVTEDLMWSVYYMYVCGVKVSTT